MSAASTICCSGCESRRRIGSDTTGSSAAGRRFRSRKEPRPRRRRRSFGTVGVVGLPSLIQPCSSAVSWQRGHTSTKSSPFGAKRTARSPIRSVRSQIAHVRCTGCRANCRTGFDCTRRRRGFLDCYGSTHVCFTYRCEMRHHGGRGARGRHRIGPGRWGVRARVERFVEPAVLLLLRERRAHGYELLDALPDLTGDARVDMGNLYRVLRALEEDGLVRSEWEADAPGPAKRTYELSAEGARLLDEWAAALRASRARIDAFLDRYEGR